jgi:1-acyl-sn-glycerol-3-phosphate acyltransferase
MRVLRSAFFWVYMAVSLMAFWFAVAIPWLFITPFDRKRNFSHWYAYTWACHYIALAPFWRVTIEGVEKIQDGQAYVMTPNHQSAADIMVLFKLRKQFRWVSKHSVFYVPFMGWMMAMAGYVGIKRGDAKSRALMMERCKVILREGTPIMIFPEGTRSPTPDLIAFKRGAFSLACDVGVPVLPIVLDGTIEALPKNSWIFQHSRPVDIRIRVLDPIPPADFGGDAGKLMAETRRRMEAKLLELRSERTASGAHVVLGSKGGPSVLQR